MTSYTLSPVWGAGAQLFDNSGNVLTGGKIYTYEAGTTTPAVTYTNPIGTVFNSNPIIADASGRLSNEIWLLVSGAYKFVLKDANDVLIATYDNIPTIPQPPISNDASSISYEQGYTVTAGAFTVGATYLITSVGTTNFVGIGAAANVTGILFTATGVGSGNGTAEYSRTVQSKLRDIVSVLDFGADSTGATDSSVAVQAAIDSVETLGGSLLFPPGQYLFTSQVTINRTYAPSGGNFVGERNLIISGYGAEIRTTGAITAFDVRGGWIPNHNCLIEGFTIYHRGNTQAVGGIRMIGTGLVTCKEVSVVVSSSLPVGYAAFSMENSDPTNVDTGSFWNTIDQCTIRPWAGSEGFCTYGVKLMGAANATTIRGTTFGGSNTHLILTPHPGQDYVSNAVNIDGNFFEGPNTSTGIELVGAATFGVYHVTGTRITNNRFETINTAVALTGTGTTVQLPTYMSGNYADTSVTNYVVNTLNIPIVILDFVVVGSPMGPAKMYNQEGVVIQNDNSSFNALTLKIPNINSGMAFQTFTGDVLGTIKYRSGPVGSGIELAGSFSPYRPLTIKGCQGIAARDTSANNLAGTSAFSASTTRTVNLPIAEADANYLIFLMPQADQKLWISARTATDFTVSSDVSSSNSFGWLLIKHL